MMELMVVKVICANDGLMDHERLLELSYGLMSEGDSLDRVIQNRDLFTVIHRSGTRDIYTRTDVTLCKDPHCERLCADLHLCKYQLMGQCNRRNCAYGHQLNSDQNVRVLREHHLIGLNEEELRVILLQSDFSLLPAVCVSYNKGRGPHGVCSERESCSRLHICEGFIRGSCDGSDCGRSHDFHEPHPARVLRSRGVSAQLVRSLPSVYRNILTLKNHSRAQSDLRESRHSRPEPRDQPSRNTAQEICLSFIKGYCRNAGKCSRIHCKMPYKWEVKMGQNWTDLTNNEAIERDYCDPAKIYSAGNEPVCFDEMTLGLDEVRRLSTASSVLLPTFILTTTWAWYWRDEYNQWIQYGSIKEMHRLSSVRSEDLERKYQEHLQQQDPLNAAVTFTAAHHVYQLNFTTMKQKNEVSGKERPVRRRPVFVSSVDVQIARSRRSAPVRTHFCKGVPGFWDQTAIPDSGFERVCLQPPHRDYVKVHDLFCKTLKGFAVMKIERVQNRELWGSFMTKKERMKETYKDKKFGDGERFLFHGIKSSLVDAVCRRNFDAEVSRSATSPYGEGIYFSRDSVDSNHHADESGVRFMFVCRVLLGRYAKGDFRYHPAVVVNVYDSFVNEPRDPSLFVVIDGSQVYPEFLVTYKQNQRSEVLRSEFDSDVSCDVCVSPVNVKNMNQMTDPDQNSISDSISAVRPSSPDLSPPSRSPNPLITDISSASNADQEISTSSPASDHNKDLSPVQRTDESDDVSSVKAQESVMQPLTSVASCAGTVLELSESKEHQQNSAEPAEDLNSGYVRRQEVSQTQRSVPFIGRDSEMENEPRDVQTSAVRYTPKTAASPPGQIRTSVSQREDVSSALGLSRSSGSVSSVSSHPSVPPHIRTSEQKPKEDKCVIQ